MFRQLGKIRKEDAESMTQGGTVVVVVVVVVVAVVVVAVVVRVVVITNLLVSLVVESFLFEECSGCWAVCWTIHTPRKIASARKTVKAALSPVPVQLRRCRKQEIMKCCLPGIWATTKVGLFCTLTPLSFWIFSAMGLSLMARNAAISTLIASSCCKSSMLILYQSKRGFFHNCIFFSF